MKSCGEGQGKGGQACMVCEYFGIRPASPAVDLAGGSPDDADRLCRTHRLRVVRGYCVLCGNGPVWASPFRDPSIGCCRRCLVDRHGINRARWIEIEIEDQAEDLPDGNSAQWTQN